MRKVPFPSMKSYNRNGLKTGYGKNAPFGDFSSNKTTDAKRLTLAL